jgi:hypothetical protein
MALFSWLSNFSIERVHPLHSKSLNSLSPRVFIPSSCLGIEWSKDSRSLCDSRPQACLGYWIFILHAYYSWSVTPRWLEVVLKLPLGMVSLGKFVLPFFVIVNSSRVSWWLLDRERVERNPILCESLNEDVRFFVNLNLGTNLVSLVCSCIYLFLILLFTFLLSISCLVVHC